jgi:hypothetical protein
MKALRITNLWYFIFLHKLMVLLIHAKCYLINVYEISVYLYPNI